MIFFNAPSVGQLKADTYFGSNDHYSFLSTLFGEKYNREKYKGAACVYYNKTNNKYWDQIITMHNAIGARRFTEDNLTTNIPLLDEISDMYYEGDVESGNDLFQFYLTRWQFPHPLLSRGTAKDEDLELKPYNLRNDYDYIKPYALVLEILLNLYDYKASEAFLKNDEFYWLGYSFYSKSDSFNPINIKNITEELITIRKNGGWDTYKTINNKSATRTHLSYPKGFLKNSSYLIEYSTYHNIDKNEYFIGLNPNIPKNKLQDEINFCYQDFFEFDKSISNSDYALINSFSFYMNNTKSFNDWRRLRYNVQISDLEIDEKYTVVTSKENFQYQLERLSHMNSKTVTSQRKEQNILRKYLFKNTTDPRCCICHRNLPISSLRAAHIKKRADCTDDEKRDINIVMPACLLGCDHLFENGYVVVKDGIVRSNSYKKDITNDLSNYTHNIDGNKCLHWNNDNLKYFEYHEKTHL